MKHIYFLASIFIFTCLNISAQTTNVISQLGGIEGMALNGNDLYISEDASNKISKINITDVTPTTTDIVTGLSIPIGVMLDGNDLYICELGANKVTKIDITDAAPTTTDVVTGLNKPYKTILHGNDLYIIEYGANKISKIDITSATPTPVDVVTGLNKPLEILLNDNDLYIAEYGAGKVTKIDITNPIPTTTTDVVGGINGPAGLSLNDNDLYISGYDDGVISKINILDQASTATAVVSGFNTPAVTFFKDSALYIAECEASVITKYILPCSSTTETISVTKCNSYTVPSRHETYTTVGTYTVMDTIPNNGGCDSVITINLTINTVDTSVTQEGDLLTANESDATYQWIDCNDNTPVEGSTSQTFTATASGSYKVAIVSNGCTDTSACQTVTITAIIENDFGNGFLLYPNPTSGSLSLDLKESYQTINLTVSNVNGKVILFKTYKEGQILNVNLQEPAGVYILGIESENEKAVIRLIKE
jgi:hypothetical protein